ncbi:MAG: hypothetical protein NVSMB17_16670 [Candidatus Dormibacteria bacterium]
MNARVTTFKIAAEKWQAATTTIQEQVAQRVSHNPAVKAGYWLADEARGKLVVVVVFESEEAMHQAAQTASQLRDLALTFEAASESVEEMVVVASVAGGPAFEAPGGH